eukprot:269188_1
MGCCVGKDDGANEDVLQDLESGSVDASEHDEFGDESKTRGFWKDNRAVMIVLALVCVAVAIFAYNFDWSPSVDQGEHKVYHVVQSTDDEKQTVDVDQLVDAEEPLESPWTLTVNTLSDKLIELKVESGDLVNAVKAKIQDKWGYTPAEQVLIFKGYELKDGLTLGSYNIQNVDEPAILMFLRKK